MASAHIQLMNHHDPVTVEARESDGVFFVTLTDSAQDTATVSDRDPERLMRLLYDAAREVARVNGLRMQREAEAVA